MNVINKKKEELKEDKDRVARQTAINRLERFSLDQDKKNMDELVRKKAFRKFNSYKKRVNVVIIALVIINLILFMGLIIKAF